MASYYLLAPFFYHTATLRPGKLIDDSLFDIVEMQSQGAALWPSNDSLVAAAVLNAEHVRQRGGSYEEMSSLLLSARSDSINGKAEASQGSIPNLYGWISWAFDRTSCVAAGNGNSAGQLTGVSIPILEACAITKLVVHIISTGTGLTAGQCFAGLYQNNTLLGSTADQATVWGAGGGVKEMPLVSPVVVQPGFVDLAWVVNFSSASCTFARGGNLESAVGAKLSKRFFTANTGITTALPVTLVKAAALGNSVWGAVM